MPDSESRRLGTEKSNIMIHKCRSDVGDRWQLARLTSRLFLTFEQFPFPNV